MLYVEVRNHRPYCTLHELSYYFEKYDSYFCPKCNRWLDEQCSDPNCEFCVNRPDIPLTTKENQNESKIRR